MVNLLTRAEEAAIAKLHDEYNKLSSEAKEVFHDGLNTLTIHPALTIGVVFALGFCVGVMV